VIGCSLMMILQSIAISKRGEASGDYPLFMSYTAVRLLR
jgi:hypothetical protein